MRHIVFAPALLMFGSIAVAQDAPRIDLDRPGALNQLKIDHPQRYQAVSALLRASEHAPCPTAELAVLKTQFKVRDLECGMLLMTSFPAKRHVSFELDGVQYAATVVLTASETLQPASLADSQAKH